MNEPKISLTLLNKMIKELNEQFTLAETVKVAETTSIKYNYVLDISKCLGLVSAVAAEAAALSHDFLKEIKINSIEPFNLDLLSDLDMFGIGPVGAEPSKKKN